MTETKRNAERVARITAEATDLTPALAREWMNQNTRNRALREGVVGRLAEAMSRGEWMENGETIKFDWHDVMIDGQHRTAAVIESGVTIPVLVVRGLDPRSQETVDRGTRRSLGDMLTLRGETYAHVLAAALAALHRLREGNLAQGTRSGRFYPSIQQAMAILESEPRIREGLTMSARVGSSLRLPSGTLAMYRYVFGVIDEADAIVFFERLLTGHGLDEGNAILALRNEAITDMSRGHGRGLHNHEKAALIAKAWSHWRRGEVVEGRLTWKGGGADPEPFPEIV